MYDDDSLGPELRQRLLTVDVPPGHADLSRAIADGQRANRRRAGLLTAAAAGVAVLATAGAFAVLRPAPPGHGQPAAPPSAGRSAASSAGPLAGSSAGPSAATGPCRPAALAPTNGLTGSLSVMNPAGTVFAGVAAGPGFEPLRWRDGGFEKLTGVQGRPVDIAPDGAILGITPAEDEGWVWREGQVTHLAPPAGYQYAAGAAIDGQGRVAGYATGATKADNVPVLWSRDGTPHRLDMLVGSIGGGSEFPASARAIADDGTVLGDLHGVPMRWTADGRGSPLPSPGGPALVLSAAGHYVFGGRLDGTPLRWDLEKNTVTIIGEPIGGFGATAGSTGGDALLIGDTKNRPSRRISAEGRTEDLRGPGGEVSLASSMSADGRTVVGTLMTGTPAPVVWRC